MNVRPVLEKRSFHRIEDLIGLSWSIIEGDDRVSAHDSGMIDIPGAEQFAEIDEEFNVATNILLQENPVIARALGLLNRKISILAGKAMPESAECAEEHEESMVSLSGSGIGFNSSEQFAEGVRLRLSLVLKPSNIRLMLTGMVKGCEPSPQYPEHAYWVRVNFEKGNETAQEQLIQHVVQRQCAQIQERVASVKANDAS